MEDEESTDTFRIETLLVPSMMLALMFNYTPSLAEILWSFSIFLESVAILPQLHMLKQAEQAESLSRYYILTLGLYRGVYIINWVFRFVRLLLRIP